MNVKTIAVFPNIEKLQSAQVLEQLIAFAQDKPIRLVMSRSQADHFNHPELGIDEIYDAPVDCGLSIGGDGTLLGICRKLYSRNIPACGINIGTVGFLADIELTELERKLEQLIAGEYRIVERTMLHGSIVTGGSRRFLGHAINDIVITKGGVARMLHLGLSVSGQRVGDYKADGMIVSTATGSTAYSLSAGGPIIHPAVKAFLVTPICPHTFTARPMVVNDTESVSVHIAAVHQDIQVTLDGQESFPLQPGDEVQIRKATNPVQIIKFEDKSYYSTLAGKLWGNI